MKHRLHGIFAFWQGKFSTVNEWEDKAKRMMAQRFTDEGKSLHEQKHEAGQPDEPAKTTGCTSQDNRTYKPRQPLV
jgi:hypothetical protein